MIRKLWVASCVALATFGYSATSRAEPATANSIQLGLGFRYGFEMMDGDFNPWGPGIGISGGYTLPNAVYVGGNFDYFFGESVEENVPLVGSVESSANVWQLMAEGGYDLGFAAIFVVRPKLGVGFASINAETCIGGQCADGSATDFAIAPGATFMILPPSFSLAVDLRYDLIFAEENTAKALLLSVGVGF